jgi:hypothetical protein
MNERLAFDQQNPLPLRTNQRAWLLLQHWHIVVDD